MNIFLACFLAVLMGGVSLALAAKSIAAWQFRRAMREHAAMPAPASMPPPPPAHADCERCNFISGRRS